MHRVSEATGVQSRSSARASHTQLASLLVLAVVLVALAIRLRVIDVPLERDEGEYAYAGQLMLEGIPPFKLAYNMKLPGTYAGYALSMAAFGQSTRGTRLGLLAVNAATVVLLFLLGRKLLGAGAGVVTAASFAFLTLSKSMLGLFGHATQFVVLPAVAGALVLVSAAESRRWSRFFASGLLLGLAVLMKQPGFVFPLFAVAWLAWIRLRPGGGGARTWLREIAALLLGVVAPIAATVAALAAAGVLGSFYFWVIQYAREYATSVTLAVALSDLQDIVSRIASEHALLLALAGAGLVALAHPRSGVRHRSFVAAFLALSLLGVCPGLYFRGHYFILALPAVSLLVGAAFRAAETLAPAGSLALARAVAAGLVLVACVQPVVAQADLYFRWPPARVSRAIYAANPFPESVEIARYIRERTRPDDTIAVIGSEPQIYFYTGRRSATGYIYVYGLMELQPLALAMQQEMIRQIEAARPAYVVWVDVPTSWVVRPGSEHAIFDWAERYLPANFDLCGTITIDGPERTDYAWDGAAGEPPPDVPAIRVLRRKGFVPVR
jgi:hypothetical protein